MRHQRKVKKLGRSTDHRRLMIRNLATSLALHGKLQTTSARAKVLKEYFEHLISLLKKYDDQKAIRLLKARLFTEDSQKSLLKTVRGLKGESGWLRLTKIGHREGDRAEITLVEVNSEK